MMNKTRMFNPNRPSWPGFPTPKTLCFGDANCMEQLLVQCAIAIESDDATLAHHILWVLNTIAPPDGDSNQRLTSSFLRALLSRASSRLPSLAASASASAQADHIHRFSLIELAGFVDLTPWHRFGFTAANSAILDAVDGYSAVHVVDLSLTHCMQIPTLIDAMASRLQKPPLLRLTVAAAASAAGDSPPPPPLLDISYEELGSKLVNFATTRNIVMEFRVVPSTYSDGFSALIEELRIYPSAFNEALVVNCHMMLHYIPDETLTLISAAKSLRTVFLKELRALNPKIVTLIDEDVDFTSNNLVCRLRSAFNYLWIPYDTVDTFLRRESEQRRWYEADISWKIENVVAAEGGTRVERAEPKQRWAERMRAAGFTGIGFTEAAVAEVKAMLEEHAAGWGMKKDDDDHLLLTWKGHNVVFATAWVSTACSNLI